MSEKWKYKAGPGSSTEGITIPEEKEQLEIKWAADTIAHEGHPERNEDTILINEQYKIFGVFDGIGGEAEGQGGVASKAARFYIMSNRVAVVNGTDINRAKNILSNIIRESDKYVEEQTKGHPERVGMGTTASILRIHTDAEGKNWALIGNVGDSRVYKIGKKGKITQVIEDDDLLNSSPLPTLKKREIAKKLDNARKSEDLTTEEERYYFTHRNQITKSIGDGKLSNPDIYALAVNKGDCFLITSDGIHDNLTTKEIEEIIKKSATLEEAVKNLTQAARARSREPRDKEIRAKRDDMSAVLVEIPAKPSIGIVKKIGALFGSKKTGSSEPIPVPPIINPPVINTNVPSGKKTGSKLIRVGLTAATLAAGGYGIKKAEDYALEKTIDYARKHAPAREVAPVNNANEKTETFYTSEKKDLSASMETKIKTPPPAPKIEQPATEVIQESHHTPRPGHDTQTSQPQTVEGARAVVLEKMGSKVETELETAQRRIAEIKEKDRNNQAITPQDAMDWNHYNYILKVAAEREAQMNAEREAREAQANAIPRQPEVRTGREVLRPTLQPPVIIENREDVYGGAEHIWANNPYFDPYAPSRNIPVPNPAMQEMSTNNSFQLSEEAETVYNANFEKIFPDGSKALSLWMKIQNKNAYKFMNRAENKVPEEYKLLWVCLKQLERVTELSPKLKNEGVEQFMNRALEKAAKDGKLDNVKLK